MNIFTLIKLFWSPTEGWRELIKTAPSIPRLFLLHVLPLSCIPSFVIVFGAKFSELLPLHDLFSPHKLQIVGAIFLLIQLMSVPLMAIVIKQLGEVADSKPSYKSAFTLAAVAPTPIWLSAILFLLPSFYTLVAFGSLALMASAGLVYYGLSQVFILNKDENGIIYFGGIMIAGFIALAFLMLSILVILGGVQSLPI